MPAGPGEFLPVCPGHSHLPAQRNGSQVQPATGLQRRVLFPTPMTPLVPQLTSTTVLSLMVFVGQCADRAWGRQTDSSSVPSCVPTRGMTRCLSSEVLTHAGCSVQVGMRASASSASDPACFAELTCVADTGWECRPLLVSFSDGAQEWSEWGTLAGERENSEAGVLICPAPPDMTSMVPGSTSWLGQSTGPQSLTESCCGA